MSTTTKYAYLRMVTIENNNKQYEMVDNGDNTFTAFWGRMTGNYEADKKSSQSKVYPMSEWDKTFRSKVKKGYVDSTDYRSEKKVINETKNTAGVSIISNDAHVRKLIEALQSYAKNQTAQTYSIVAKDVTQKMVDDAQDVLNTLSGYLTDFGKKNWSLSQFNTSLVKLFSIIPRKMTRVQDHLMADDTKVETIQKMLAKEQDNLDSMASQVTAQKAQEDSSEDKEVVQQNITLLDSLGLELSLVTDAKVIKMVKEKAQEHAHRVCNIYAVNNKKTTDLFKKNIDKAQNKLTELMWHGSRRANWMAILQMGLMIRPSSAVYSGSMFGDGIYSAREADKSLGYTDGGRWTGNSGGSAPYIYMGLFEFHYGKQKIINRHDSSCYDLHKTCRKDGYDSVWAKKGPSLHRDEMIVYGAEQATIRYIVEFKA